MGLWQNCLCVLAVCMCWHVFTPNSSSQHKHLLALQVENHRVSQAVITPVAHDEYGIKHVCECDKVCVFAFVCGCTARSYVLYFVTKQGKDYLAITKNDLWPDVTHRKKADSILSKRMKTGNILGDFCVLFSLQGFLLISGLKKINSLV